MSNPIVKFLQSQIESQPQIEGWKKILEFYKKRLFHQLTEEIIQFCSTYMSSDIDLYSMYKTIVPDMVLRLNNVSHAKIIAFIGCKLKQSNISEAIDFMTNSRLYMKDPPDVIIYTSYLAKLHVYKNDLPSAHDFLASARILIDEFSQVNQSCLYFYDSAMFFHFTKSDYSMYYSDALKFYGISKSGYLPIDDDGVDKAYFTSISCIMSPHVTNVGAVIYNKHVTESLENGGYDWLIRLLSAFNLGDISGFDEMVPELRNHDIIGKNIECLGEKVILMRILNLSFEHILKNSPLTFFTVSHSTGIDVNQVERFLIRAMSLNIIKGSIDQLNEAVKLTWVKPKFLSRDQILALHHGVNDWKASVNSLISFISDINDECHKLPVY